MVSVNLHVANIFSKKSFRITLGERVGFSRNPDLDIRFPRTNGSSRAKSSRGKWIKMTKRGLTSQRWTDEDKIILVSAWINVSNNVVDGTSQKRVKFFKEITVYYHEAGGSTRDVEALRKKWDNMSRDVMKFGGCMDRIMSKGGSSFNEYDFRQQALELFKKEQNKDFSDLKCWEVLRTEPKWSSAINMTSKLPMSETQDHIASSDQSSLSQSSTSMKRPIGNKAAKRKLSENQKLGMTPSHNAKEFSEYLRGVNTMNQNMAQRNDLMRMFNQLFMSSLMHQFAKSDLSEMTAAQKKAYEMAYLGIANFQGMVNAMKEPTVEHHENSSTSHNLDENITTSLDVID